MSGNITGFHETGDMIGILTASEVCLVSFAL